MNDTTNKARLRWRCRRGMRELDALMLAWLDTHYDRAEAPVRAKFAELLALQDPDIMTLLKPLDDPGQPVVQHSGGNPADHPESSKESSFETIIQQARDAAKAAAREAAKNASAANNQACGTD